jgi:hypothetical protein
MANSVTDFLFQGSAPPSVQSYGTSTTAVPQWQSDYMLGVLNKANTIASQPYQTYNGQRIAATTPAQQQGWATTMQGANAYQPYFAQAGQQYNQAAGGNASAAAAPNLGAATGLAGQAGQADIVGAAQPYLANAAQTSTQNINSYMSPYTTAVVNNIADQGNKNLMENILPGLGDDFIRSGQLGSSRQNNAVSKAVTDTQTAITQAQTGALQSGYTQALGASQADLARQLQIGQTQGNLAQSQAANQTSAAGALANIGQIQGNFNSVDTNNALNTGKAMGALGTAYQAAGLQAGTAMDQVGQEQQGQTQKNLDLAYSNWQDQKNYPQVTTDWMAALTRGQPTMGSTQYKSSSDPANGGQTGTSGMGYLTQAIALQNAFKAKGGQVNHSDVRPAPGALSMARKPSQRPRPVAITLPRS